jgi:voltage-gated potassium channel
LNPNIKIVTRAVDKKSADKIAKAGADRVVSTHFIGAMRMVSEMIRPQVARFLDVMLQRSDDVVRIEEVRVGNGSPAVGQSMKAAVFGKHPGLLVLAVYRPGSQVYQHNPAPEFVIEAGAVLVVMAGVDSVQALRKELHHSPA